MNHPDKATLFREFAKLLKADFHLDRTFTLLLNQNPGASVKQFLRSAQERLGSGVGLTEALRHANGGGLTALDAAMIGAGEQSGRLAQSFALLADYYESLVESSRKARGAMLYPLILAHLGVILPELPAAIAADALGGLPWRILTRLGVLWGGILLVSKMWKTWSQRAETVPGADRLLANLPLLGSMRRHWALARFTQVAHSALLAAVRPQEWMRLAGEASGSGQFREGSRIAAGLVAEGQPVAASLRAGGGFPKGFVDALDTAEETGTLDHEMARWARLEAEQARTAMDRVAVWLPRVLYAVIALYVAARIIGMMSAIYAPLLREMGA
jgi:type II secretory pathway component PulF